MRHIERLLVLLPLLASFCGWAQLTQAPGEWLSPLHARPVDGVVRVQEKSTLHTFFIYEYLSQEVPVMDDFSVDRTRHLNAAAGDADVTYTTTTYRLDVAGDHSPDLKFSADTTWHYTTDTTLADSIETTRVMNPSAMVTVLDISTYPGTSGLLELWPPYTIRDTLTDADPDTSTTNVDYTQDSLLVYTVSASTATYDMNGSPVPLVLWQDDDAYINGTYPIDPPTVGVASFEGLARDGYPYDFDTPSSYGIADHLTSVPINLLYPASDSIYLSFFYQPQGLSGDDQVQTQDSLVLEMYAPDEDTWYRVWRTPYFALEPFEQVMLPITDPKFLKSNFQMRFLNYATLSGALDHWHVDYVRLGRNRAYDDTVLVDVTYVYPEASILDTYTAVPYKAYALDPVSFMADNVTELQKNLDVNDRFITYGMQAGVEGQAVSSSFNNGNNISGNASSTFGSLHAIQDAPNNFAFDPLLSDTCAYWSVKFWTNATPDINRYNDTIRFTQVLSDYYAYDDGSAEAGYSLNVNGAKLAYKFDIAAPDSLRAVRMYFDPIFEDPSAASFLLTVWSSISPEVIQMQNVSFSTPEFRHDGLNHFVEYPLDSTIMVGSTFYVGWTQTTATKMNLGFDKNRDNSDRIFYKVGSSFANSSFAGSLMIRPVFVCDCDGFTGVEEHTAFNDLELFPNPADQAFTLRLAQDLPAGVRVSMIDAMGRETRSWSAGRMTFNTSDIANGLYVVRATTMDGRVLAQGRIMVQH